MFTLNFELEQITDAGRTSCHDHYHTKYCYGLYTAVLPFLVLYMHAVDDVVTSFYELLIFLNLHFTTRLGFVSLSLDLDRAGLFLIQPSLDNSVRLLMPTAEMPKQQTKSFDPLRR